MKLSRWFVVLVLLGLSSSTALADGLDPVMKLGGSNLSTGLVSGNDLNFTFTVHGSDFTGVGQTEQFDFINATGQTAMGVDLLVTLLSGTPSLTFSCENVSGSGYFTGCSVTPLSSTQTLISFFGPDTGEGGFGGIPNAPDMTCDGIHSCSTETAGADFGVFVTDVNGDLFTLGQGQGFAVQGTLSVPEPSTVLLLLAGVVLLFLFRRPLGTLNVSVRP